DLRRRNRTACRARQRGRARRVWRGLPHERLALARLLGGSLGARQDARSTLKLEHPWGRQVRAHHHRWAFNIAVVGLGRGGSKHGRSNERQKSLEHRDALSNTIVTNSGKRVSVPLACRHGGVRRQPKGESNSLKCDFVSKAFGVVTDRFRNLVK